MRSGLVRKPSGKPLHQREMGTPDAAEEGAVEQDPAEPAAEDHAEASSTRRGRRYRRPWPAACRRRWGSSTGPPRAACARSTTSPAAVRRYRRGRTSGWQIGPRWMRTGSICGKGRTASARRISTSKARPAEVVPGSAQDARKSKDLERDPIGSCSRGCFAEACQGACAGVPRSPYTGPEA